MGEHEVKDSPVRNSIDQRLEILRELFRGAWFRRIALIWALVSFWDTFISEMLPESISVNAPRVYKVFFWILEKTSGWLSFSSWLSIGMAILAFGSIEFAYRWTRDEQRRLRYLNPAEVTEKDMLDFLVEGIQATDDITAAVQASSNDTERFAKMLTRSSRIMPFITSFKLRRKYLSRVARNINRYSDRLQRTADFIGHAGLAVRNNQIPFIERSIISSEAQAGALLKFAATAGGTANTLPGTISSIEQMRQSAVQMKGISGELNFASYKLATVLGDLIDKIEAFRIVCEEIQAAATKKLDTIQRMIVHKQ